mgnify:CR=1 FL=1
MTEDAKSNIWEMQYKDLEQAIRHGMEHLLPRLLDLHYHERMIEDRKAGVRWLHEDPLTFTEGR